MTNWIRRGATALVGLITVVGVLLLWGQVDTLQAQVRGLTTAQMDNRLSTVSLDYFNPELKGNKGSGANIPLMKSAAPATLYWTGTFQPETPNVSAIGGTFRRFDFNGNDYTVTGNLTPKTDGSSQLGTPQLRVAEVNAKEGRFFCPGGPVSSAGSTICYDPDDPLGGAWKLLVGGQTLYVQVSDVHP